MVVEMVACCHDTDALRRELTMVTMLMRPSLRDLLPLTLAVRTAVALLTTTRCTMTT